MTRSAPADPAAQLRWLVDRAEISELFFAFARAVDDKNQLAYADLFIEDGVVELPHGATRGREALRVMRGPPAHWSTQHISTNHQIILDGDHATARAYLLAAHVFEPGKPSSNARAGGWYDAVLARTPEGWRFESVKLSIVWSTGEMVPRLATAPAPAPVQA